MKSGILKFLEPSGLVQACNGADLPYKIMKTNGRCMIQKMSHNTTFRLIQNYLTAYMFIVIALNH